MVVVDVIVGQLKAVSHGAQQSLQRYQRLLAARNIWLLLGSATISYIGDWFNIVALTALSYQVAGGAIGVGGMLAVTLIPRLIFQGLAGALVDRSPGRRLLMLALLLLGVLSSLFVVLTWVPLLWLLYMLVFATETVQTVVRPAFMVLLMRLVPQAQRGVANALHSILMTVGASLGPLLGAILLPLLQAAALFILNGLTFVVIALAVRLLRDEPTAQTEELISQEPGINAASDEQASESGQAQSYWWLLRQPAVVLFIGLTLASSLLILGTMALFPVRSQNLGLGESGVGYFYAMVPIGAFIGGIIAGIGTYTTRLALMLVAGAECISALCQMLFGLSQSPVLALIALAAFGVSMELGEVAGVTFFQNQLPDKIYGRFFSLFLMAHGAGGLFGALLAPLLEQALSAGSVLVLFALPTLGLASALGLTSWTPRKSTASIE
jgi:sugar phosphate permease